MNRDIIKSVIVKECEKFLIEMNMYVFKVQCDAENNPPHESNLIIDLFYKRTKYDHINVIPLSITDNGSMIVPLGCNNEFDELFDILNGIMIPILRNINIDEIFLDND